VKQIYKLSGGGPSNHEIDERLDPVRNTLWKYLRLPSVPVATPRPQRSPNVDVHPPFVHTVDIIATWGAHRRRESCHGVARWAKRRA
jgi:hypothetical protein